MCDDLRRLADDPSWKSEDDDVTPALLREAADEIERLRLVVSAADDFYYAWAHSEGQEEAVGTLGTAYWNARKEITEVEL